MKENSSPGSSPDYRRCLLCPRSCGVDRSAGQTGACRQSDRMVLACATRHFGEEPPLTGRGGSGALFFTGCTMRCSFCQNRQLSRGEAGREILEEEFVRICLDLQAEGAENINLVSATPFIPSLEKGLRRARAAGLCLPVVWNSSGYELPEQVERLAGFVDIFLPDLKLMDPELSGRLFGAKDYPARARAAVKRMAELYPVRYEDWGDRPGTKGSAGSAGSAGGGIESSRRLISGTIVRHLVLPGLLGETRRVMEWFAAELREQALFSLMVQFFVPEGTAGWKRGVEALENRPLTECEYGQLMKWLEDFGIEEGFIQEPGGDESWWPDFGRSNPFPPEYSKPVWSWTV